MGVRRRKAVLGGPRRSTPRSIPTSTAEGSGPPRSRSATRRRRGSEGSSQNSPIRSARSRSRKAEGMDERFARDCLVRGSKDREPAARRSPLVAGLDERAGGGKSAIRFAVVAGVVLR
jgi:hypothetical protein